MKLKCASIRFDNVNYNMYRYLTYKRKNGTLKKVLKTYSKRRNCWVLIGTSTF